MCVMVGDGVRRGGSWVGRDEGPRQVTTFPREKIWTSASTCPRTPPSPNHGHPHPTATPHCHFSNSISATVTTSLLTKHHCHSTTSTITSTHYSITIMLPPQPMSLSLPLPLPLSLLQVIQQSQSSIMHNLWNTLPTNAVDLCTSSEITHDFGTFSLFLMLQLLTLSSPFLKENYECLTFESRTNIKTKTLSSYNLV